MPDRKLKIVSTGAGDPTFEIEIELQSLNGDQESQLGIDAIVGNSRYTAMNRTFQISTDKNVKLLSSFTAPDVGNDPIPATVTFSNSDNIILQNNTGLNGTISNNQISFPNITHISPISPNLNQIQKIGLHSRKGNGNDVFLTSENTNTNFVNLFGDSLLLSDDFNATWNLISVNSVPNNLFYLKQGNNYLVLENGSFTWQQTIPNNNNGRWVFMPNSSHLYQIYNNGTSEYLTLDTNTGIVSLVSGQPSSWYLHFFEE